ncbi:MAG: hypothetical protein JNL98_00135 [Bryobacterales bacterium]|nr:hypothetical protein [Bryobacterales bacterium]
MFAKSNPDLSHGSAAQFNILAVAPEDAPFVSKLQELRQNHPGYEIVSVVKVEDAIKLLRRGTIAAVLLYGHPTKPGTAEFVIEGLSKERPPRFVVFCDDAPGGLPAGQSVMRVVRSGMEATPISRLLDQCCQEFDQMARNDLTPLDLMEALVHCPDAAWIRVTHESGESGDFCIQAGRAVYCEVGRMSGTTAAARLLSWTPCRFEYRDFPSFVSPNLDRALTDLRSLQLQNATQPQGANRVSFNGSASVPPSVVAATKPAPAAAAPQPPRTEEPSVEEPTDFPVLAQLDTDSSPAWAAPSAPPELDGAERSMDEPDEFPAFTADAEPEIRVDEPTDMLSLHEVLEAAGPAVNGAGSAARAQGMDELNPEEPLSFPDFDVAPAKEPNSGSTFFASVAVVSFDHLLSCNPSDEAAFFEARALFEVYDRVNRYSRLQGLGDQDFLVIGGKKATIAIAPIVGSENLLAVRLKAQNLGDPERYELHRLQEVMQLTYATVAV